MGSHYSFLFHDFSQMDYILSFHKLTEIQTLEIFHFYGYLQSGYLRTPLLGPRDGQLLDH